MDYHVTFRRVVLFLGLIGLFLLWRGVMPTLPRVASRGAARWDFELIFAVGAALACFGEFHIGQIFVTSYRPHVIALGILIMAGGVLGVRFKRQQFQEASDLFYGTTPQAQASGSWWPSATSLRRHAWRMRALAGKIGHEAHDLSLVALSVTTAGALGSTDPEGDRVRDALQRISKITLGMTRADVETQMGSAWKEGLTAGWASGQHARYTRDDLPDYYVEVHYDWTGIRGIGRRSQSIDPVIKLPALLHR